jgi:hypothetical protein
MSTQWTFLVKLLECSIGVKRVLEEEGRWYWKKIERRVGRENVDRETGRVGKEEGRVQYILVNVYAFYVCSSIDASEVKKRRRDIQSGSQQMSETPTIVVIINSSQHQKPPHAYRSQDAEYHQAEPCNGYQDSLPSNPDQPCPT